MYIRKKTRIKDGKRHDYWALVESYRTERGPRQLTVAWLGELDKAGRLGVASAAGGKRGFQSHLFEKGPEPERVKINANGVRVKNIKDFGRPWLCMELISRLHLDEFFTEHLPGGREHIAWSKMALVLVICRLCRPSSELHIAEHLFEETALADLLGIPSKMMNEDRLYRALE